MTRKSNQPVDVFKHIDMSGGPEACWPFTGGLNSEGRPYFQVDGKKILAYRLTWELFTGEQLGDRLLRHKCDNQVCCNPRHGEPGNHDENMNDMKTRERHGLTHHMIRVIKKQISLGFKDEYIASMTGLTRETIRDIRLEKNYAHVKMEGDKDASE